MTPASFVAALANVKMPGVFNPWRDVCPIHDLADAPIVRRDNLERFLSAAVSRGVKTMWIARDLGYRGGRRTGVPLTDELHLSDAGRLMGGISLNRSTVGTPLAERTAAVIWRVLGEVGEPVMLWNVFPFHPHDERDPMSNRCHTKAERLETWPILEGLIDIVKPEKVIAIGRDASSALSELGVETVSIRHPSYGGQTEFITGMFDYYGVGTARGSNLQLDFPFSEPGLSGNLHHVAAS